MPRLTRFFVKSALVFLVLALSCGGLLHLDFAFAEVAALRPVFYHLFLVGFVTQLIFGISYWMFPPLSRESARGREWIGWCSYAALNTGLALRVCGEPLSVFQPGLAARLLLVSSAVLQLAAVLLYTTLIWNRVKAK